MIPNWNNSIPVGNGCSYAGISRDATRTFCNGRALRFILYGAYNAYGLIGPENNGIALLDVDARNVILDKHLCANTGYLGPTPEQKEEFTRLLTLDFNEIVDFVAQHPRARYAIAKD